MTELSIAVITPSYNQGRFVERTIQSVLSQTLLPSEYVVMDGGSTDETVEILKKYGDQFTWSSKPDGGQSQAINQGITSTSADIIGWLNSDDVYHPDTLQKVKSFFETHPDIDVVYGQANHIDVDDKFIGSFPVHAWNWHVLKTQCYLPQPSTFVRRRAVQKAGLLREDLHYCMDYEYWLRMAKQGIKFAYLPHVLADARIYSETKSGGQPLEMYLEVMAMLQTTLNYIPANWLVNYSLNKTKIESKLPFPIYVLLAWANLWRVAGIHHCGLARAVAWYNAQANLLQKTLTKCFGFAKG